MNWSLVKADLKNLNNKFVNIQLRVAHGTYGEVLCIYHVRQKSELKINLSRAFVEGQMIPFEEHKRLTEELNANKELHKIVEEIGLKVLEENPRVAEKRKAIEKGNLTLEYLIVLSAKTRTIKVVNRIGKQLEKQTEYEKEEHKFFVVAKFTDFKDEFELEINYKPNYGYKVIPTKSRTNKEKVEIRWLISEDTRKQIIDNLRRKVKFSLPEA